MADPQGPLTLLVITRANALVEHVKTMAYSCERGGGLACRVLSSEQPVIKPDAPPKLLLIDLDATTDAVLADIPRLRQQAPGCWVVVTYQSPSSERLLKAMRSGANDYLSYRHTAEEFSAMLLRVAESDGAGVDRNSRVVTVFSNKGGVGTSTIAINTAAAVAAHAPGSVVLVDLVLQHGDISLFLDLPSSYTIVNLASEIDRADPSYLKSALPKHPSGMYVVPAPYALDDAELVTPVQVGRLLQTLRAAFPVVIVDASNEFNEQVLSALDISDTVLLVSLPNLPSIRNTKRCLELFDKLHYDATKVVLVMNRHNAAERVGRDMVEEALGRKVDWSIPNDYVAATRAVNQGTVLRMIQSRSALVSNFDKLASTHVLRRVPAAGLGRTPLFKNLLKR